MQFRPRVWPGVLVGSGTVALLAGLAALLARRLLEQPVSLASFAIGLVALGLLLAAGLFLYWTAGCARLRYHLDRNRLALRWGWTTHLVPLATITAVLPGSSVNGRGGFYGVSWLGHHTGHASIEGVGQTVVLSAHLRRRDLLYLVTPSLAYAISVPDPQRFALELRLRQLLGPSEALALAVTAPGWSTLPLWRDGVAFALFALGLLANAALFAYLCYAFPSLPELLPMRFTAEGVVEQVGLRTELLLLPAVGLVVMVANTVLGAVLYRREPVAAYLCLGVAVLVQGLASAAALQIVS